MLLFGLSEWIIPHCIEKRKIYLRIYRKKHLSHQKIFGKYDENSLENTGFALAFCAISLYNENNIDYGGVCVWVN